MSTAAKINTIFRRMDGYEVTLCKVCNRACHKRTIQRFFVLISRLGDGVFWYTLMCCLPIFYGWEAVYTSIHMGLVAAVGVAIYKFLKLKLVRPRPFAAMPDIMLGTAPLDVYSFPSGHTLHAVSFSIVAISYYPELMWFLMPFVILVAISRVVLGLHYPTDVLAGVIIGATLAESSFAVLP